MLGLLGLRLVTALTTAGIVAAEVLTRHPLHLADRGVRLRDNLRQRARF